MKDATLYRICTEDLNRPAIECVMQNAGLDCTLIPARGLFQGIPENALVIECVTNDRNAVEIAARAIVILNKQTCILVERLAIQARFITAKHESRQMMAELDEFTKAYIECALWSSTDDQDQPLNDNHDVSDMAPETLTQIIGEKLTESSEAFGNVDLYIGDNGLIYS